MTKKVHQQNFPMNKWTNFSQDSYAFLQLGIRLALLVFIVHPPFDVCKGLFFIFLYYPELQGSIVICSGIANVHCRILIEKDDEIGKLRNSLIEISEEVSKMHGSLTTLEKSPTASKEDRTSRELDTHETRAVISKLQHVHTSIQQYKRYMQLQITKKQQNSYFFAYT